MELEVCGVINIQFAVKDEEVYILEVNPRASRTIPFVSKSIGVPLAKLAAKIMVGKTLEELGLTEQVRQDYFTVKEAVFPFVKFPGVDVILGPEMLSTGEVMGISSDYGIAYAKSQLAAGAQLPTAGTVLFSVRDADKARAVELARQFHKMGFKILATKGTCIAFIENNIPSEFVLKVKEGRPNIVDRIINGQVDLIINTTVGKQAIVDSFSIRRTALDKNVPYVTTIRGARAVTQAIHALQREIPGVQAIQSYYQTA